MSSKLVKKRPEFLYMSTVENALGLGHGCNGLIDPLYVVYSIYGPSYKSLRTPTLTAHPLTSFTFTSAFADTRSSATSA